MNLTLREMERAAWLAGDSASCQLIALALDAEEGVYDEDEYRLKKLELAVGMINDAAAMLEDLL
jgi:hypothetical protein